MMDTENKLPRENRGTIEVIPETRFPGQQPFSLCSIYIGHSRPSEGSGRARNLMYSVQCMVFNQATMGCEDLSLPYVLYVTE